MNASQLCCHRKKDVCNTADQNGGSQVGRRITKSIASANMLSNIVKIILNMLSTSLNHTYTLRGIKAYINTTCFLSVSHDWGCRPWYALDRDGQVEGQSPTDGPRNRVAFTDSLVHYSGGILTIGKPTLKPMALVNAERRKNFGSRLFTRS